MSSRAATHSRCVSARKQSDAAAARETPLASSRVSESRVVFGKTVGGARGSKARPATRSAFERSSASSRSIAAIDDSRFFCVCVFSVSLASLRRVSARAATSFSLARSRNETRSRTIRLEMASAARSFSATSASTSRQSASAYSSARFTKRVSMEARRSVTAALKLALDSSSTSNTSMMFSWNSPRALPNAASCALECSATRSHRSDACSAPSARVSVMTSRCAGSEFPPRSRAPKNWRSRRSTVRGF